MQGSPAWNNRGRKRHPHNIWCKNQQGFCLQGEMGVFYKPRSALKGPIHKISFVSIHHGLQQTRVLQDQSLTRIDWTVWLKEESWRGQPTGSLCWVTLPYCADTVILGWHISLQTINLGRLHKLHPPNTLLPHSPEMLWPHPAEKFADWAVVQTFLKESQKPTHGETETELCGSREETISLNPHSTLEQQCHVQHPALHGPEYLYHVPKHSEKLPPITQGTEKLCKYAQNSPTSWARVVAIHA